MENYNEDKISYLNAKEKVKKIKGFYIHLLVYIAVNVMIVFVNIQNLKPGESYFQLENFFTAFFWGIGLLAHGLSVFSPNFILGKDWEEKKIRELMDKYK